jgi:hypothetical protein
MGRHQSVGFNHIYIMIISLGLSLYRHALMGAIENVLFRSRPGSPGHPF